MIARYTRPQMAALWSEEAQFRTYLDVEVAACEAWATLGKVPKDSLKQIQEKAGFDIEAIHERERETKHDLAAFVSVVQEKIGEAGRYLHLGLTSSDIVDTAFSYRLTKSADLILQGIDKCLEITARRAKEHRKIAMIGRTHGIHAEPTTMGAKWLLWHDFLKRGRARIVAARAEVAVGKLSGSVGNYANVPPEIEAYVSKKLGLTPDSLSTQVVSRDRHASYFSALGLLGSAVEAIAVELRHLQRTEVGEAREGFTKGQKGSSSMPHKRNPITAENLTGLARLLRSYVVPAMENCALWHERDISHSSVERVMGPDANILADFMLARLATLLEGLEIFPERMRENLEMLQGTVYSQRVLTALIEKGLSRDEAYAIVQTNALQALDQKKPFLNFLKADKRVTFSASELDELCSPEPYFQHVGRLYEKVLGEKQ